MPFTVLQHYDVIRRDFLVLVLQGLALPLTELQPNEREQKLKHINVKGLVMPFYGIAARRRVCTRRSRPFCCYRYSLAVYGIATYSGA